MNDDISIVLTLDDQEFTVGVKNAGKVLKQFERRITSSSREVDKLDLSIDGLAAGTRDLTVILATAHAALQTVYSATLGWQKAIMDAAGEIERLEVMMRGMSDATTAAQRDLDAMNASKFITDFAQDAPFRMEALTDTFVKFKTVGIDPMSGSMKALTDSVAHFGGNSDILHRASIAIQQMMGKGVISMEELRQQLGEAVPSAMQIMARSMQMTVGELVGHIETGTVESETALRKMLSEMAMTFDGAGIRMMTTWQGILQSMETRWKLFLKEIAGDTGDGTSYFNTVKGMVDELSQWMVSGEAKQFAAEISEAMGAIARAIRNATVFLYENRTAIVEVGKVLLFYFVTSRVAMAIAGITASLSRLSTTTGILGTAMGDFRHHLSTVQRNNERFRASLESTNGVLQRTNARVGNLVGNLPHLGMALMSLAGPVGMVISVITTAGFALLQMAGSLDTLAERIIRTHGLIATAKDIKDLKDKSETLRNELAMNHEAMSRAIEQAADTQLGDAVREQAQGTVEAMMARNAAIKEELALYEEAIIRGEEGIYFRAVEGAKANTTRALQALMDPISAAYNARRNELMERRREAQGDQEELQRIADLELQAIEEAYQKRVAVIDKQEARLLDRQRRLKRLSDEDSKAQLAEIEASLAAIANQRNEIARIRNEAIEAQSLANAFIDKGDKGTPGKVPQVVKDSQRAVQSMARLVDGFSIKLARAQGKAQETNPHLEGLVERISQLQRQLRPQDRQVFDQLADQAIAKAEELHRVEQAIKFEKRGQQAFMQVLNRTASALGDTEQARQLRIRVQTRELDEQLQTYEELVEKMREFGVDEGFVREFSDSLVEYHDAAMDKIVSDNASSWDQMMREIREFEADWSSVWKSTMDQAVDEMVRFVREGKFSFTSLVDHILEQILRIQLQKAMVEPMSDLLDFGIQAAGSYFGGSSGGGTNFMNSVDAVPFANGGIMTAYGPIPLRKYANGGIARSPQVAVYGEGSRPEAYVPLPDGRSIPVTMEGQRQAPSIHVNVINESGQPMQAKSRGGRFDGESYILDVVMKAANRPGNFRDSLKGVIKS